MFVCRDRDLVRDGVQDLFSRLWSARSRVGDADSVRRYLYRSLRRIIILQATRNRKQTGHFDSDDHIIDPCGSIEEAFIDKEFKNQQLALIRNAIHKLSRHQREVVLLRFFNGLSYVQIAEIMDLHVESVYNLSSKAMEQLRVALQFSPQLAHF